MIVLHAAVSLSRTHNESSPGAGSHTYMAWCTAGTSAFEVFQPSLSGAFEYLSLPENKQEEEIFNRAMTTFTKGLDNAAKLHVSGHVRAC